MTVFRYPGGKKRLLSPIIEELRKQSFGKKEYREPFFGGGSVGLAVATEFIDLEKIWINDKDFSLSCLWTAIINEPEELIKLIELYTPSVDSFVQFKKELITSKCYNLNVAFKRLVVHQLSYSGLGLKGGPLGGFTQLSNYKIDCRWSAKSLSKNILKAHEILSSYKIFQNCCTNKSFEALLERSGLDFIFADPPYFHKGNQLYDVGFSEKNHIDLSELLKRQKNWVLSYDDCKEIRELYEWANIKTINTKYSMHTSSYPNETLPQTTELIISPK